MSTDSAWEEWGRRDPYFGVITDKKFRLTALTQEAKNEFFESGRLHAEYVLQMIRQYIDPTFKPLSILDFGCGVGQLVVPFARLAPYIVGLDVSRSMLQEAKKNCDALGISNAKFFISDDFLSELTGKFNLIHSFIVFQHIPPERGRVILRKLLMHLAPGGAGALHFSYSKSNYSRTHGVAPRQIPQPVAKQRMFGLGSATPSPPVVTDPIADPEMQMNPYSATEILFMLQSAGIFRFHAEFTDHGGELGLFLFFQKPA